jgi:CDGSH-type Zn-finger protein/uncharacterized Fe-S cluster protein YjdI
MASSTLSYKGKDITITYDVGRCIHAAECVKNAPAVFDPHKKPWIDPDGADPDQVASSILRCPSGALKFERKDGGPAEEAPRENKVQVQPDGPLYVTGDIEIEGADGEVAYRETRVALCRCGASTHKPFCDNSHIDSGFGCDASLGRNTMRVEEETEEGPLKIKLAEDGPIIFEGPVTVLGTNDTPQSGARGALCRCGHSANRPYCDGTHRSVGFTSD